MFKQIKLLYDGDSENQVTCWEFWRKKFSRKSSIVSNLRKIFKRIFQQNYEFSYGKEVRIKL